MADQLVNGAASASAEFSQETDAAADVIEDLKKASLDEKTDA